MFSNITDCLKIKHLRTKFRIVQRKIDEESQVMNAMIELRKNVKYGQQQQTKSQKLSNESKDLL